MQSAFSIVQILSVKFINNNCFQIPNELIWFNTPHVGYETLPLDDIPVLAMLDTSVSIKIIPTQNHVKTSMNFFYYIVNNIK